MKFYKNKKILITGGTGLIGIQLANLLVDSEAQVTVASLEKNPELSKKCKYAKLDLRILKNCLKITKGQDFVFHLAGIKGSPKLTMTRPYSFMTPMILFNTNMMEACRLNKVKRYLYTSSIGVYNPKSLMSEKDVWKTFPSKNDWYSGWAKRIGELQGDCFNVHYGLNNFSIVRPANVYGKGDDFSENGMVIPQLVKRIHTESPFICWGDGSPIRDFIHADDVADGILLCYEKKITEPINLGSGKGVSIKELVDTLVEIYDGDVDVKWDKSKPNGDAIRLMDMTRANKHGFYPKTDLKTGLKEVVEYYESIS